MNKKYTEYDMTWNKITHFTVGYLVGSFSILLLCMFVFK